MSRISIPTKGRLPPSLRLDASHPAVVRTLSRLSRPSLLALALDWLDERNLVLSAPYLRPRRRGAEERGSDDDEDSDDGDDDDLFPPARSLPALRDVYADLAARRGAKREVVDRVLEGDWRHGLSLYQLAMADLQHLYDHPGSQRWSAYRVVPLETPQPAATDGCAPAEKPDRESLTIPRFHPPTFVDCLQAQLPPDVKAHFTLDRREEALPGVLILRVFVVDSPYATRAAFPARSATARRGGDSSAQQGFDAARTLYVAFPDAAPFVYISRAAGADAQGSDARSLLRLLLRGIPAALSRPRERVSLAATALATRNLGALAERRGGGRTNAAGGGWGWYATEKKGDKGRWRESPLDTVIPAEEARDAQDAAGAEGAEGRKRIRDPEAEREERAAKRRRAVAHARFGEAGKVGDGKGVERVDIRMEDPFPPVAAAVDVEAEEEADDDPQPARRRSKGGRRSEVEAAFQQEAEAREERGEQDSDGDEWRPGVRLTFHGTHVFAGLRQLVEAGIIDGERMPGWMTGEEGVTVGAVRHGRIRGHKGSGV